MNPWTDFKFVWACTLLGFALLLGIGWILGFGVGTFFLALLALTIYILAVIIFAVTVALAIVLAMALICLPFAALCWAGIKLYQRIET